MDRAAAATIVARSSLRVHMVTSSVESWIKSIQRSAGSPRTLPADSATCVGSGRQHPWGGVLLRYLPAPPAELELALEPPGPEEPAPLAPDEPPDWPCVLLTALAPVPDLSRHSLGIALREAYFDSSQRLSFCATCDFLSV